VHSRAFKEAVTVTDRHHFGRKEEQMRYHSTSTQFMNKSHIRVICWVSILASYLALSLNIRPFGMAAPKLRILCLHGKQQNKDVFRAKLGKIPRKLKDVAEFTVIDAPFILEDQSTPEQIARTWFHREVNGGPIDVHSLREGLDSLLSTWSEIGPFDGVFGFSMGGTMASIMASATCSIDPTQDIAELETSAVDEKTAPTESEVPLFPGLRFVICAGAVDIPKEFAATLDQSELPVKFPLLIPTRIQSLHIAGSGDTAVPISSSRGLAGRFTDSKFVEHAEGHHIPMKTPIVEAIDEFVRAQIC